MFTAIERAAGRNEIERWTFQFVNCPTSCEIVMCAYAHERRLPSGKVKVLSAWTFSDPVVKGQRAPSIPQDVGQEAVNDLVRSIKVGFTTTRGK